MKKILFALLVTTMVACTNQPTGIGSVTRTNDVEVQYTFSTGAPIDYQIVEVTYDGETHEYLKYFAYNRGSVSHWEGCKYCKNERSLNR